MLPQAARRAGAAGAAGEAGEAGAAGEAGGEERSVIALSPLRGEGDQGKEGGESKGPAAGLAEQGLRSPQAPGLLAFLCF
jgi:hypothetical protein